MTGDAVSIRFSRRIHRKSSLLPVKLSINKTRRSVVKKRTLGANSSLCKAKESAKFVRKSKLEKNPKRASCLITASYKVKEKAKIVQKSKLDNYPKQTSEKSSHNLKPTLKKSRKNVPKISDKKRKTRSSLNASQVYITDEVKQQTLKIGLANKRKKSVAKKNLTESASNKKHSVCSSLTVSKPSVITEDKATSKILDNRKQKLSRVKKHTEKKGSLRVTNNSSKTVSTQSTEKSSQTSRHSKGKKSAQLSAKSLFPEISLNLRNSEPLIVTPPPDKVTCLTRRRENKKSATSLKGFKQSSLKNSGISPNTSGFQSILGTPNLENHSEKRRSSRLSELNQIRTPNKELSPLTSTSVLKKNQDSILNKSSHSSKSAEICARKQGRPRKSIKEIPDKVSCQTKSAQNPKFTTCPKKVNPSKTLSSGISSSAYQPILETPHFAKDSKRRKSPRLSKGSNQSGIPSSEISQNSSGFQSILETPHPGRISKRRKSSRVLEPNRSTTLNKEVSLSTPSSVLKKKQDSMLNKSSQISISAETPAIENNMKKRGRPRVSNEEIATGSFVKPKSTRGWPAKQKKSPENFKLPFLKVNNNLPHDVLSTPAFKTIIVKSKSDKCLLKPDSKSSKRKLHQSATETHFAREGLHDANKRKKSTGFPNCPVRGTLKHKRWLLNHLKESNGYEDDIFENQNFNHYKNFQFGEESDGSSVNIATPKFDCILTPVLPKKTPRFKDCISPMELLQARKTAEEYLFRRNKKRKSGDMPSSSGKNTSINTKNTSQDIPEKKKLDFGETVNKLIEIQKNLEKDAEIGDEDEDSYFSDASN